MSEHDRDHRRGDQSISEQLERDAKHTYEDYERKSRQAISGVLSLKEGEGGKKYIFGLPVPKGMEDTAEQLLGFVRPFAVKYGNNKIYSGVKKYFAPTHEIAEVAAKEAAIQSAHNKGLWGARAFTALLLGAQPIINSVQKWRESSAESRQLRQDFGLVFEASPSASKTNEIIQTAESRIGTKWYNGMWQVLATDLPTLIPAGIYAAKNLKDLESKANESLKREKIANKPEKARNHEASEAVRNRLNFVDDFVEKAIEEHRKTAGENAKLGDEQIRYIRNAAEEEYKIVQAQARDADNAQSKHSKEDEAGEHSYMVPVMLGTTLVGGYLGAGVEEQNKKDAGKITAADMARYFKQEVEKQCGKHNSGDDCNPTFRTRNPDQIRIMRMKGMSSEFGRDLTLKEFIAEIAKQNELDHGRAAVGDVFMPDLLNAVTPLANMIANNQLAADAVTSLVGERKIITYKKDSAGHLAREFATQAQVEEAIKPLLPYMGTREIVTKKEDLFANFREPQRAQETIRDNLKTMTGKDQALFAALLPEDLLKEFAKGVDFVALRKEAYDQDAIYNYVAANVVYLNDKGADGLKKLGMDDKSIRIVSALAAKVQAGDTQALKQAVDGGDKGAVFEAVRMGGLLEQMAGNKDYWTDRGKKMVEIPEAMKKAQEEQAQEKEDRTHRDRHAPRKRAYDAAYKDGGDVHPDHESVDHETRRLAHHQESGSKKFTEEFEPEAHKGHGERVHKHREKKHDSPEVRIP